MAPAEAWLITALAAWLAWEFAAVVVFGDSDVDSAGYGAINSQLEGDAL